MNHQIQSNNIAISHEPYSSNNIAISHAHTVK